MPILVVLVRLCLLLQTIRPVPIHMDWSRPVALLTVLQTIRPVRRTANPFGSRPVLLLILSSAFLFHATRKDGMLAVLDWILLKMSL